MFTDVSISDRKILKPIFLFCKKAPIYCESSPDTSFYEYKFYITGLLEELSWNFERILMMLAKVIAIDEKTEEEDVEIFIDQDDDHYIPEIHQ